MVILSNPIALPFFLVPVSFSFFYCIIYCFVLQSQTVPGEVQCLSYRADLSQQGWASCAWLSMIGYIQVPMRGTHDRAKIICVLTLLVTPMLTSCCVIAYTKPARVHFRSSWNLFAAAISSLNTTNMRYNPASLTK